MKGRNVVFMLYDSRSGSTWLSSILHGYSNIHVLKESTFVSTIMGAGPVVNAKTLSEILKQLARDKQNEELGFDVISLISQSFVGDCKPEEFVESVVSKIRKTLRLEERVHLVVKDQMFGCSTRLARYFTEAYFLCLVRDGWEVFLSKRNTIAIDGFPMTNSVITSAVRWTYFARCTLKLVGLCKRVTVLKYHELNINGREYLERELPFLLLPYDDSKRIVYASQIGASQQGLHRNILKSSARRSYQGSASEKHLYRVLTARSARKLGFAFKTLEVNFFSLATIGIIDFWRYCAQKMKTRRRIKL